MASNAILRSGPSPASTRSSFSPASSRIAPPACSIMSARRPSIVPSPPRAPAPALVAGPARAPARRPFPCRSSASHAAQLDSLVELMGSLVDAGNLPNAACEPRPQPFSAPILVATRDIPGGSPALEVPGDVCITAVDAGKSAIAPLAEGRSELVQLALWLMDQARLGPAAPHAALLASLPDPSLNPILWSDAERRELLQGSAVLAEAEARRAALLAEWASIEQQLGGLPGLPGASPAGASPAGATPAGFTPAGFTPAGFLEAFCRVLAAATYLESAQCFCIVPVLSTARRMNAPGGATVDYDLDKGTVVVRVDRMLRSGSEVFLFDERPNVERALALGSVEKKNPADFIEMPVSLIKADRLFMAKKQILEQLGYEDETRFPVYLDQSPLQIYSYLRLSRVSDPGELAKISFDKDVIVSQMNEYEILQLLLGDCRERLAGFADNAESDQKLLQDPELSERARMAAQLRLSEKRIISSFMDAVRRRLAPIRGIPTKGGRMEDPNQDIIDMFDMIEAVPAAPKKLFDGIARWARGEDDPEWKRGKGRK